MEPDRSDCEGDLLGLLRVGLVELIVLELAETASPALDRAVRAARFMLALPVVAVKASVVDDL